MPVTTAALILAALPFSPDPADAALVAALGHPEYHAREAAQVLLVVRLSMAPRAPAVGPVEAAAAGSPSPEVRARCRRALAAASGARLARAAALLDEATGLDYPAVDALVYDPATGEYDYARGPTVGIDWRVPGLPAPGDPARPLAYLRARSRTLGAKAVLAGWDPADVVAEYRWMHRVDARYYVRTRLPWDGAPAPYLLELLRWDAPVPAPVADDACVAPAPVPAAMPAP